MRILIEFSDSDKEYVERILWDVIDKIKEGQTDGWTICGGQFFVEKDGEDEE